MGIFHNLLRWLEDRTGIARQLDRLAHHRVPPDAKWMYVFGSATLLAFGLQIASGIALSTLYVPSTGEAYESLRAITGTATLGRLLRGIHFFGASAMIVLMVLHLIRVFLTASYKFPREMNWLSGSVLLILVLGMGFTGQLLRWDQNAVWSVVVGAEQAGRAPLIGDFIGRLILGGETLGADTLSRFFALHVFVLPGTILGLVGLHLYLVLRNGISEPPQAGRPVLPAVYRAQYEGMLEKSGVPFWPDAVWRDAVFGVLVLVGVILLAWLWGPPPVGERPDPTLVNAHPRPDWYLLFYFALLALLPHGLENVVILTAPLLLVLALVLLPLLAPAGERSPLRRPWAIGLVLSSLTVIGALTVAGREAKWSPRFDARPLPAAVVASGDPAVRQGASLFHDRACIYCHQISGYGGRRGPSLTHAGSRLTREQLTLRILNGGYNMPAYGAILEPDELDALLEFLATRR